MNEKIKSINDLSITLHEINKEYKIQEFIDIFKKSVGKTNANMLENIRQDTSTNIFQKITNLSDKITETTMENMITFFNKLNETCNYDEYMEKCGSTRSSFLKDRKNYFSSKAILDMSKSVEEYSIFDLTGTAELILGDFLDKLLYKIYPAHLDIVYENASGKKITTKLRHRKSKITKDYIEAPMIDRYHGLTAYDSFLLRSYYDINKNDWLYIPVRFIMKISCDEELGEAIESIK